MGQEYQAYGGDDYGQQDNLYADYAAKKEQGGKSGGWGIIFVHLVMNEWFV